MNITHLISLFQKNISGDFFFKGESHDFWEFIYIDKGKMLITAGDKQYVLKAGELAFHKPGEFHGVCAYNKTSSGFIVAAFACVSPCMKFFEHRIMSLTSKERGYLYESIRCRRQEARSFSDTGTSLFAPQMVNAFFGQTQMVQQFLELLLINLIQRNEGIKIQNRVETYSMQKRNKRLTDNVIKYLEDHISEQITLKQLAKDLGYSVPQMKKLFRIHTNKGIIDYFIDMKMNEAKRLMQEDDLNITQIAVNLGYMDISYFSRIFKSRSNMTPKEYSRSCGGSQ